MHEGPLIHRWWMVSPDRGVIDAGAVAGWSSSVARWAHNPEVAGSNPAPATNEKAQGEIPGPFRSVMGSASRVVDHERIVQGVEYGDVDRRTRCGIAHARCRIIARAAGVIDR